jgi:HEAT repeat protein
VTHAFDTAAECGAEQLLALALDRSAEAGRRVDALWVLGRRRERAATLPLLGLFLDGSDAPEVREEACRVLDQFGAMSTVRRPLLRVAEHHPARWARLAAVETLANLYSRKSVPTMLRILENRAEDGRLRSEAAHTIGMAFGVGSARSEVVRRLIPHLFDCDTRVRFHVMYALSQCRRNRALAPLRLFVNDHTDSDLGYWWDTAREARWAINCIRNRRRGDPDVGMPDDPRYGTDDWEIRPPRRDKHGRRR